MQGTSETTPATRLAELRLQCEREIPTQLQRVDSAQNFCRELLDSSKSEAKRTMQLQEKLGKLKEEMREADDALGNALAVKARKEAKMTTMKESISVTKAKVDELKRIVEDQQARRDEYATIISQQSEALKACKENHDQDNEYREQIAEAISWYKRVLGFRIECGHGVKFIFTNINPANPKEEYSFTVRHENDIYILLGCDPHVSDTKEMVHELNKSNELFKFVRAMRVKFQQAAAHVSVSTDLNRYETPVKDKGNQFGESDRKSRKAPKNQSILSPGSASSLRRSSRLKGKKVEQEKYGPVK